MSKRDENKRSKRVALLDAALQLFTDKGLQETSVLDITQRSGVAKGTFYLYFKDKYDIRNKLIVFQSRKILKAAYLAMLAEHVSQLEDQLIYIANYALNHLSEHQDLLLLISKNLSWGILKQELTRSEGDEGDTEFVEAFHGLTERAGVYPPRSEMMLYLLVELISSSCYSAILYSEPCDLETLKPYLFQAVRQIVRQFTGDLV